MQHGLLGIGLLLIAAIVAALAAPLFVDWNAWRAEFERRASALVGAPVTIKGPIEATILPLPAFALRDVTIGEAQGSGLRAAHIRGVMSLGALLRGRLEAEEIAFAQPEIRLSYRADGKIDLPAGASGTSVDNFSISRVTFDGGTIAIRDPDGKETKYETVSGFGTLQSRTGPFKLEFSCKRGEQNFSLRISASEFRDATGKVRLALMRVQDGIALEADGNLSLAEARPRFEGKIGLSRRVEGALPWKLVADAQADLQTVALNDLALALGGDDNAIEFAGSARLEPRAAKFEASLAAKRADLDRLGNGEKPDLISAMAPLRAALAQLSALPLSGRVAIAVDDLVAGGGVVRDLKGEIALREGVLSPLRLEARLPGLATMSFAARAQENDAVRGVLKFAAEEPAAFARWLGLDRLGLVFDDGASLRLDGELRIAKQAVALNSFALAYGGAKWSGTAAYGAGEAGGAARFEAKLAADKPDLAQWAALLPRAADFGGLDVALSLDARAPKLLGSAARRFDAALSLAAGALSIERLSLEDFDGLNLRARGRLEAWRGRPQGRIDIETEASKAEGLASLTRAAFATGEAPALAKRIAAAALPLQMKGAVSGDGTSAEVAVELGGRAGEAEPAISARLDPRSASLGEARIVAEAPDAARLVALLGLPWPEPHAGQGRLEVAIGRAKEGIFPLKANLAYPGINLAGEGDLRAGAGGRIEPRIDLRLQATDVRALSLAAARAATSVVPASGTARLLRADDAFVLENIALDLGSSRARGRIVIKGFERPSLGGTLSLDRAELPVLLALMIGRAGESVAAPWPDRPFGPAALENAGGMIEIESATLGLVGPFVANGARLKLRFADNEAAIEDFSGELAGGKLSGTARFARANPPVVDGNFSLAGADVARLTAPGAARGGMRGRANLSLQFSAQGNA
ncbi:MAG TPA: AsmA family protein, partial [Xanthobacteraceae bacterium]|nr:AsmA family protein [Xanthobacteraceae bacterium]